MNTRQRNPKTAIPLNPPGNQREYQGLTLYGLAELDFYPLAWGDGLDYARHTRKADSNGAGANRACRRSCGKLYFPAGFHPERDVHCSTSQWIQNCSLKGGIRPETTLLRGIAASDCRIVRSAGLQGGYAWNVATMFLNVSWAWPRHVITYHSRPVANCERSKAETLWEINRQDQTRLQVKFWIALASFIAPTKSFSDAVCKNRKGSDTRWSVTKYHRWWTWWWNVQILPFSRKTQLTWEEPPTALIGNHLPKTVEWWLAITAADNRRVPASYDDGQSVNFAGTVRSGSARFLMMAFPARDWKTSRCRYCLRLTILPDSVVTREGWQTWTD